MITEIISEIKKIKTEKKNIRDFALVFFAVLIIISIVLLFKHNYNAYWIGIIGLIFLCMGFVCPKFLCPLYKLWMSLAIIIGFFMNKIILTIFFFIVLTPVGIVLRLLKKDILNQQIDTAAKSYWIKKKKQPFDPKRYEKLF